MEKELENQKNKTQQKALIHIEVYEDNTLIELEGLGKSLLIGLGQLVYSLQAKDCPEELIIESVASAMAKSASEKNISNKKDLEEFIKKIIRD